jgi:hypothetical protein
MLEEIFQRVSVPQILLFLVASYVVYDFVQKISDDRKIRQLGGRAPLRRSWFPFGWGLDIAYQGLMAGVNNTVYDFFREGEFVCLSFQAFLVLTLLQD